MIARRFLAFSLPLAELTTELFIKKTRDLRWCFFVLPTCVRKSCHHFPETELLTWRSSFTFSPSAPLSVTGNALDALINEYYLVVRKKRGGGRNGIDFSTYVLLKHIGSPRFLPHEWLSHSTCFLYGGMGRNSTWNSTCAPVRRRVWITQARSLP